MPPASPKHGEPIAQKEMAFRTSFVGDAALSVPALALYMKQFKNHPISIKFLLQFPQNNDIIIVKLKDLSEIKISGKTLTLSFWTEEITLTRAN